MATLWTWCRLQSLHLRRTAHICCYSTKRAPGPITAEEYPRITVPQRMVDKINRAHIRKAVEESKQARLQNKTPLLSCKRTEYNCFKGQGYPTFDPKQLASHGWKHRNCGMDYFTLHSHASNPAMPMEGEKVVGFTDMGLDERIVDYLVQTGIVCPTKIQELLIPRMLQGEHVVSAAETGSGKTLAYLLPIVHNLINQSNASTSDKDSQKNCPRTIIVVPSKELAEQTMNVCTAMSQTLPITPFMLCGNRGIQRDLKEGIEMDILIATPGILKRMITSGVLSVRRMLTIVLDEADTLLDDSFSDLTVGILEKLQISTSGGGGGSPGLGESVQLALVSATYPRSLEETVTGVLPVSAFKKVTTQHLHHLMPHVPQKFIRMKSVDKTEELLKLLKKTHAVTMIFCNTGKSCYWLSRTLDEWNIQNICISGFISDEERAGLFRSFQDGHHKILVCTDVASRGLDTQLVDHVINFDFPKFMSDYVHRAGRVGRVGSSTSGHVTSFIVHAWEVDLVWKIEIAARQQSQLHNVNANIRRKIDSFTQEKSGLSFGS